MVKEARKYVAHLIDDSRRIKGIGLRQMIHEHNAPFSRRTFDLFPRGFFVKADSCVDDDMLWQDRYQLDFSLLPTFIESAVASKILTVGKAINFLRHLCGDSAWIIGPMAKVIEWHNEGNIT